MAWIALESIPWLGVSRIAPQRVGIAILGMAILASGVVAVFLTENGTGSAALITLGALAIGVAVFSDRIETIEFGGARLTLRVLARQRFELAVKREQEGDIATASRLRRQAHGFERLANTYGRIRRSTPSGPSRTEILDGIVSQASQLARSTEFEPADVWSWFDQGDEQARVIVLGLMQGDERLRDLFCALEAIENPQSRFEGFHALVVAERMLGGLNKFEAAWLREAIREAQRSKHFRQDGESMRISEEILRELTARDIGV